MLKRKYVLLFFISIFVVVGSSCTVVSTSSHSPQEWVTLANSGLSGRDNYTYHAQIETGVYNNIKLNMASFNGEVHSHNEYTISGEDIDATLLHPAKYMDIINQEGNQVQFADHSIDQVTKSLQVLVKEKEDSATNRWKTLIQQQFAQVKLSAENNEKELSTEQYEQSKQLLQQSEQKLNEMLTDLNVQSSFVLTIDTVDAVPLKIEEHAVLSYTKDGKPFSEYRNSSVNLQY